MDYSDALSNALRLRNETLGGLGETALTMGSHVLSQIPAGIASLGSLLTDRDTFRNPDAAIERANQRGQDTSDYWTYEPKSDVTQRGLQNVSDVVSPAIDYAERNTIGPIGERFPVLGAGLVGLANLAGGPEAAAEEAAAKTAAKGAGRLSEVLTSRKPPGTSIASESGPILPRDPGGAAAAMIPAEQKPIPRVTPMGQEPELNERSLALLRSKKAAGSVDDLIAKGQSINPDLEYWYGSKPLMDFARNEGLSQEDFENLLAHLSNASQRNRVLSENKIGSYLYGMAKRGEFSPESQLFTNKRAKDLGMRPDDPGVVVLPKGIGSLAQLDIFDRAKALALGAKPEDIFGEKINTYLTNKLGNETPVTVDVNATRGPVMSGRLGDWLATRYEDTKGRVSSPRDLYESGKLKMKDALKMPGYWEAAPQTAAEYKAFEDLWSRGAQRAGVSPAGAQALGWYGSGDVTGLATQPKTYMELLEQSARTAAKRQGITPVEAMRRMVRGAPGAQLGMSTPAMLATLGGASLLGLGAYGLNEWLTGSKKDAPLPADTNPSRTTGDAFRQRQQDMDAVEQELKRQQQSRQPPAMQGARG